MTPNPAPTSDSPGVEEVSPDQLLRTARLIAADPALLTLVDPDEDEPQRIELESSPHFQAWLLFWPAGTQNGWHDHGESAGAFHVVRGTLLEQTSTGHRQAFRTLVAGEGRSFDHHHLHQLANVRVGTALSVHIYAPTLTTTTRYTITPTGLRPTTTDGDEVGWTPAEGDID